jgi:hypothetical protein
MPHPSVPWLASTDGRLLARDPYDIETWRRLGWCLFDPVVRERAQSTHGGGAAGRRYLAALERYLARNLARARRFSTLLADAAPAGDVRAFVFGGDCAPTRARVVVERERGRLAGRERPDEIVARRPGVDYTALMFEPGDLVVTRSSLLGLPPARTPLPALAIEHAVFLCEEHRLLTANATFQNNLLHTLTAEQP